MNSLSKKKAPKTGLMTSMITQEKPKCSPGSRTPDWYNPDYKNETTTETKKCLKELSKSL